MGHYEFYFRSMKKIELTEELPYIEFRFDKNGKMKLTPHPKSTWGGINSGFICNDGSHGNVCNKPELLDKYISTYLNRHIVEIDKDIKKLEKTKQKYVKLIQKHLKQ